MERSLVLGESVRLNRVVLVYSWLSISIGNTAANVALLTFLANHRRAKNQNE